MSILLSLCASVFFGVADFLAGVAGRKGTHSEAVLIAQPFALIACLVALAILPGATHIKPTAIIFGSTSGIGEGLGMIALYKGMTLGKMSVVAPVLALLTGAIPVTVGFILGNRFSLIVMIGIILAIIAVVLIAYTKDDSIKTHSGLLEGILAGAGFGIFLTLLDRAGTSSSAWPLVASQLVALIIIMGFYAQALCNFKVNKQSILFSSLAGALTGIASVFYFSSTGMGKLAIVAILASLGPAITVLLARLFLSEKWGRIQLAGLILASIAVILISF